MAIDSQEKRASSLTHMMPWEVQGWFPDGIMTQRIGRIRLGHTGGSWHRLPLLLVGEFSVVGYSG